MPSQYEDTSNGKNLKSIKAYQSDFEFSRYNGSQHRPIYTREPSVEQLDNSAAGGRRINVMKNMKMEKRLLHNNLYAGNVNFVDSDGESGRMVPNSFSQSREEMLRDIHYN